MKPLTQKKIKANNIKLIFQTIQTHGRISRVDIAHETGISLMTVGKIADVLLDAKMIEEEKDNVPGPGRKPGALAVAKHGRSVLILDLASYTFRFCLMSLSLQQANAWQEYSYDRKMSYEENLAASLRRMQKEMQGRMKTDELIGVGVCVPGPYYPEKDIVINELVPEIDGVNIKAILAEFFKDMPVYIDQDVSHSARYVGMYETAARHVFYAYIDEGVGGAAYYHGALFASEYNYSGEFGQLALPDGETLEAHISTKNLQKILPGFSLEQLKSCTQQQKAAVDGYVQSVIKNLADAFCSITWLLDPQLIMIESLYISIYPRFIEELKTVFDKAMNNRRKEYLPQISGLTQVGTSYKGAAQAIIEKWLDTLAL